MTIAITGASGHLGRLVIAKLKEKVPAADVIALARTPAKAADLGVAVREADYTKPETLARALAGVETLLLVSSSEIGQRAAQHRNVIDAAKASGVKRIVYTSVLHADTSPLGLPRNILQPRPIESLRRALHDLAQRLVHGKLYGRDPRAGGRRVHRQRGQSKISSAARADYAEAAAVVLTGSGHEGKIYELAGDSFYTLADLAAEVSRQTGRTIPYKNLPEADYAAALLRAGLPESVAKLLADSGIGAAKGALFDTGHQLSGLIGRPRVPLATTIAAALG